MKTDELIESLASDRSGRWRWSVWHSLGAALVASLLLAFALLLVTLPLRSDWIGSFRSPGIWIKVAFTVALAICGLVAVRRVSTPGMNLRLLPYLLLGPVVLVWAFALVGATQVAPGRMPEYLFGSTWMVCPLLIAMLSAPVFFCVIWTMRHLAVTRPALAGAVAGVFSGAIAATVYCLHCPEVSPGFVGIWYVLGILIPTIAGLALGSRLLRW